MRQVVLYIAMSIDGYIADDMGRVDWLQGDGSEPDHLGTYDAFLETIDAIVMGAKTYRQIQKELSPNHWPYPNQTTYVISHQATTKHDDVIMTSQNPVELVDALCQETGKDIWICGGASIINPLLQAQKIDRMRIAVIPTILGKGIRLFESKSTTHFKWIETITYNGINELIYELKKI